MFERSKRDTNEESKSFPAFETRETKQEETTPARKLEAAVIGPSIQIRGDLSGEEDLIIQGKVSGTIQLREKSLTIGSQGQVEANVLANSIIVEGEVNGDLYGSQRVSIRKSGNVQGNIVSPKVSLDEGCRFKGSIDMDQEMVSKAFANAATVTSVKKTDQAPSKPVSVEKSKSSNAGKSSSPGDEAKSGSAGSA